MGMRRFTLTMHTPAEAAIFKAMEEVEKLGADVRLTNAIHSLHIAKEDVSNYIDEQLAKQYSRADEPSATAQ